MKNKGFIKWSGLILVYFLCNTTIFSQTLSGRWWGMLTFDAFEIRLALQIDQDSSGYTARLNSPDQVTGWTPIDAFEFNYPRVKFDLPDVAHTFKKGHRIMVQVQHSWFPLVDRNPQKFTNIYTCTEADFQKAIQRIYHDTKHASNLRINVLVIDEF